MIPPAGQGLCVVAPPEPQASAAGCPTSLLWRTFQNCFSGAHSVGQRLLRSSASLPLTSPRTLPSPWGRQEVSLPQEALQGSLCPRHSS